MKLTSANNVVLTAPHVKTSIPVSHARLICYSMILNAFKPAQTRNSPIPSMELAISAMLLAQHALKET